MWSDVFPLKTPLPLVIKIGHCTYPHPIADQKVSYLKYIYLVTYVCDSSDSSDSSDISNSSNSSDSSLYVMTKFL